MSVDSTSRNIFKINNPQRWWCRVSSLASAHSTMRIDVVHLKEENKADFSEILYLEFRKVAYFSGWLTWINAGFRRAEGAEKASFLRSIIDTREDFPDEQFISSSEFGTLTLFVAEGNQGKRTYIFANAARLSDSSNNTLFEVG